MAVERLVSPSHACATALQSDKSQWHVRSLRWETKQDALPVTTSPSRFPTGQP